MKVKKSMSKNLLKYWICSEMFKNLAIESFESELHSIIARDYLIKLR